MLDLKKLVTKITQWINNLQTVATYADSGKTITIPSGSSYSIYTYRTITLAANGKYLILVNGGCGAVSGTTTFYSIQTSVASGTPVDYVNVRQQTNSVSGGPNSGIGYFETGSTAVTLNIQGILYGSANGKCTGGWHNTYVVRLK